MKQKLLIVMISLFLVGLVGCHVNYHGSVDPDSQSKSQGTGTGSGTGPGY